MGQTEESQPAGHKDMNRSSTPPPQDQRGDTRCAVLDSEEVFLHAAAAAAGGADHLGHEPLHHVTRVAAVTAHQAKVGQTCNTRATHHFTRMPLCHFTFTLRQCLRW